MSILSEKEMTAQEEHRLPLAVCDVFFHLLQWNLAFSLYAVIFLGLSIHVDVHDMFCYELLNKLTIGFFKFGLVRYLVSLLIMFIFNDENHVKSG